MFTAMFFAISSIAQVTTSSMSGRITDKNGSLPGATVLVKHIPSGTSYGTVTNNDGRYIIQGMRVGGPYTIEFSYVGYNTAKYENIQLYLGEPYILNVRLVEGKTIEGIEITAESMNSNMNTERAGAVTAIDQRAITSIPTTTRSLNDAIKLTPQATSSASGPALGGGNYRQSYVSVDGAAFNNAFGIGQNIPSGGSPISLDALDQISISLTPYDVRQSGFLGGSIQAVTKSGTNKLHVSVYDYFTNDTFLGKKYGDKDSTNNYQKLNLSETLKNTVGINIGGPIIKDKLFYFVNFEYETDIATGQTRLARENEDQEWGSENQYNRPTVSQMDEIRNYLMENFNGYDPGRYQNYSTNTPDYKLLARIDWNINKDHKLNVRFTQTSNKYSSDPSSSISPFSSNVYNRNTVGRTSMNALYFESARYYQEQNFMSIAGELNSSFLNGKLNNVFRATYSKQHEPRSFVGDLFPTVDILENDSVLTTFGPDPFTYGNLRDVSTVIVTDEISYQLGKNTFTGGLQFEWDKTKNGYMQGGAGYYVYNSWQDFVENNAPKSFMITHPNNNELTQEYPSFTYMQYSVYLQDEVAFSENFKGTLGLRVEVPTYPSLANNYNIEFTEGWTDGDGVHHETFPNYATSDMPSAKVNFSPRLGFNWDILGNRNLVLRGGTGIFTGRLPFVWIVSVAGNSNVIQAQYIAENNVPITFYDNIDGILEALYGGAFEKQELSAPTSPTLLSKDLRMPQNWKSSLALDINLFWGIKATVEGIYSKELTSVAVTKLGIEQSGSVELIEGVDERETWVSQGIRNSLGRNITPYLIENTDNKGWYYSVTAMLEKKFDKGFTAMVAYTRSESKSAIDGSGDQITSAFSIDSYVSGANNHDLGYSSYVTPDRFIASVSYSKEYAKYFASTISLFYEGYRYGYAGTWGYSRYSYTLSSNVVGDGGASNLLYVPTETELDKMNWASETDKTNFWTFVQEDKYLSSMIGKYTERNGAIMPWRHTINLKFMQDFYFFIADQRNTLQVGVDIYNLANLLNPSWGNVSQLSSNAILAYNNGEYSFTNPKWNKYAGTMSTWAVSFSLRYIF
jgi:hypothetical protein